MAASMTEMSTAAEEFRANKAAQIARAKRLLQVIVASPSRAERVQSANEIEELIGELDAMVEQVVHVKAGAISAAISQAQNQTQRQPAVCSTCLKLLTESESELADYIELVVRQARAASWPEDACRAKLRAAMRPGDRVGAVWLGRIVIVRPDGRTAEVYQRES
jgi:hypothetical protein